MPKELIINAIVPENIRVALFIDGLMQDFFEETQERFRTRSNIYLGKVKTVQPSLDACFVDYGENKQGFLPVSEIVRVNWAKQSKKRSAPRIDDVIKRNQFIIVQVDKEPISTKGARLTTDISLAGRHLVLTPYSEILGVSRKIIDPEQRKKYKELGASLKPPKGMGIIIRTVGFGQNKRALARDMNFLARLWNEILKRSKRASEPGLLHTEADIVQRVLRDYYTNDIDKVWIDDQTALEKSRQFLKFFMPREQRKLAHYEGRVPIFSHFNIEEQIESIHRRKVDLPSGGSLVIDQTEALVAIDVNSGKMRHKGGQEDTAYETNKEAATEIGRQLKLRNLGGIVVIDFIDMTSSAHKTAVERALRDSMRNDKARRQIGKISAFGLCTLTRQRLDQSINVIGFRECPTCGGDGVVREPDAVAIRLLRKIQTSLASGLTESVKVRLHPDLANFLQNKYRRDLASLEQEFNVAIEIEATNDVNPSEEIVEIHSRQIDPKPVLPAQKDPQPEPAKEKPVKAKRRSSRRKPRKTDKQSPKPPKLLEKKAGDKQVQAEKKTVKPKKRRYWGRKKKDSSKKPEKKE
ncbi:MAG: Rne/Rng family ribonuclease [Deltaproteobacteria bacterium]|nr:Rne/Rng family ribonuclease [Deltaproteobacteria bacterium]